MTETARLNLALLAEAQAQKHVTVNEALAHLDAVVGARARALAALAPPDDPAEGDLIGIGTGATGAFAGKDGKLAFYLNGGWRFLDPLLGQRLWDDETGAISTYLPTGWTPGGVGTGAGGARTSAPVIEIDHDISGGPNNVTAMAIPDKAVVIGVSARVVAGIVGPTSWQIGVLGAPDRYGSGFGTAMGSFARGVTTHPQAYFGATPLLLSAEGGLFASGRVRLAVHCLEIAAPAA
ncbi:MAG: DUF2793 domain-containing protein [Paracoccaceae bacterium]